MSPRYTEDVHRRLFPLIILIGMIAVGGVFVSYSNARRQEAAHTAQTDKLATGHRWSRA